MCFSKKHSLSLFIENMYLIVSLCLFSRYLDRIIRLTELEEFSALLADHQKATTADGETYM